MLKKKKDKIAFAPFITPGCWDTDSGIRNSELIKPKLKFIIICSIATTLRFVISTLPVVQWWIFTEISDNAICHDLPGFKIFVTITICFCFYIEYFKILITQYKQPFLSGVTSWALYHICSPCSTCLSTMIFFFPLFLAFWGFLSVSKKLQHYLYCLLCHGPLICPLVWCIQASGQPNFLGEVFFPGK